MVKMTMNAALAALCLLIFCLNPAGAQEKFFGYNPIPKEQFDALPKTSRFRAYLPVSVDMSSKFPTPASQGRLNSCVGFAVGYAARSYYAVKTEGRARNSRKNIPSPSYIYHSIRDPQNCLSGSQFIPALELLKKGSLSLADHPYAIDCLLPTASQKSAAKDFKIDGWISVNPKKVDDVKGQLALGHPVIFGMNVTDKFERLKSIQVYSQQPGIFQRHAMTAVGYSDRKQAFKIINSWGTGWGKGGFGWISYRTFAIYVEEAYVMRVSGNRPKPKPKSNEVVVVTPKPTPRPKPKPAEVVVVTPKPKPKPEPEVAEVVVKPDEPNIDEGCQMLTSTKEAGSTKISGFVGTAEMLQRVRKSYPAPQYTLDVELRPWPQCEVLKTLNQRLDAPNAPQLSVAGNTQALKSGDPLVVEVTTPKEPSYIYISYVQADGSVVHLHQPTGVVQSPSRSKTKFIFGDGKDGRARFTVSKPFGREMLVVLASASPLFDKSLSDTQIEREYLSALRKALIYKTDPQLPDRNVSAAFMGLLTKEN